mgnify:CR=1 FL=1
MLTVPIRNKYSYFVVKLDCSRVLRFGYVEGLEKYSIKSKTRGEHFGGMTECL